MCDFISFFVSVKHNKLICGNPFSHNNALTNSAIDDWREAEWTENGLTVRVTEDEDESAYLVTVKCLAPTRKDLCNLLSPSKDKDGNVYYFNENGWHRENDLPAVEYANGDKYWFIDGKLHRDNDLPAIEYANGDKKWYVNGKLHRENGLPAVEYANGDKKWYVNGERQW